MNEQKLAAKITRRFKWAKDPKTVLPLASVVLQLVQLLMGGHPTKSREFKERRIDEIAREFGVPSDDIREMLSWVEPPFLRLGDSMQPLIVKLGGSVITDKSKKFSVRQGTLERLAEELASAEWPLIVVHGGGSFGHPLASEYGLDSGYKEKRQLMGFSLTHRAMERLNAKVVEALQDVGFAAVAIQPSACAVVEDGRIVSMELRPFHKLLELGLVPITYGDVVPDLTRGMSILSGDQLVVYLARELGTQRIILGVDVGGVYTGDPKVDREAKIVPEITPESWSEIERSIGEAQEPDVTGGMANKVRELLKLAERGVEAQIVNAMKPEVLKRAILGERLGTRITRS